MRRRWTIALLFVAACTADARCNPTFSCEGATGPAASSDAGPPLCPRCPFVHASAGPQHTCATVGIGDAVGEVRCWGANDRGQALGDRSGEDTPRPTPPLLASLVATRLGGVPAVTSAGELGTCASAFGQAGCWGTNAAGALGGPLADARGHLLASPIDAGELVALAIGAAHGCTLDDLGVVRCFGDNGLGQLGRSSQPGGLPYTVPPIDVRTPLARALAVGPTVSCAVPFDEEEATFCWGSFDALGGFPYGSLPSSIAAPVTAVAVGARQVCEARGAIVTCFGPGPGDSGGQLLGAPVRHLCVGGRRPVEVTSLVEITYPAPVGGHACAALDDGGVVCWGANDRGQLGDGTTEPSDAPRRVPLDGVASVSCGGEHTCAVTDAGRLFCWGDNRRGQLARPPEELDRSPTPLPIRFE